MIAILYRDPLGQVSAASAHISLMDAKQIQRSSAEEIQKIAEQVAVRRRHRPMPISYSLTVSPFVEQQPSHSPQQLLLEPNVLHCCTCVGLRLDDTAAYKLQAPCKVPQWQFFESIGAVPILCQTVTQAERSLEWRRVDCCCACQKIVWHVIAGYGGKGRLDRHDLIRD